MTRARLIFFSITGVAAAWLLWASASKTYFSPRRELLDQIEQERATISRLQETINKEVSQRRARRDTNARTLAGTSEETVSLLRERLNTIGHGIGLTDLRVSTGTIKSVASAARSEYRDSTWKSLTAQPDFYTLGAEFSGQGTFEQAIRAIEVIAAEPYLSRVDRFSLRPRRGGEVVDVSVSLTTLVLPDAAPPPQPAPDLALAPSHAAVSGKNLFRAPPPAPEIQPEVKPAVAAQPAPPAPVPWGDWVVTGIVWIDQQPELWLRNRKTSEAKQLRAGDRILVAQVEEISRTQAVVSIEGARFSIQIGQSLEDRRPANQ